MKIYSVTIGAEATTVFKTLKEARTFVKENADGEAYRIERVEIGKLTLDLLCDVINSNGGSYVFGSETVEEHELES